MLRTVPSAHKFTALTTAICATAVCLTAILLCDPAFAQEDNLAQVKKSLAIKPDQAGVDYDQPDAAAVNNCKVASASKVFGVPGWVVYDNTERILRLFVDRNKDRKLDQWSYFKDGVEVYRDSDNDFDGKLDEFRWLGNAGMRKGVDANEDGEIDKWEMISVEEIAQEAFNSIKYQDNARFARLLISDSELSSLGLTGKVGSDVNKRVDNARKSFSSMVRGQRQISKSTTFVYSGTGQPGVAASSKRDGITKDIVCYDHASVVYKNGESVGNLALGTIVKVNGSWRLIELPEIVDPKKPILTGGSLFPMQLFADPDTVPAVAFDPKLGKLYEKFEEQDKALLQLIGEGDSKKNAVRIASLHEQKAMAGVDIYKMVPKSERYSWLKNIADTVSDAYQKEEYPRGLAFLKEFSGQLKRAGRSEGLDYIRYRSIFAEYQLIIKLKDSRARGEALEDLMTNLKGFVKEFPDSEFAPDALFQLAFNSEIDNNDKNKQAIAVYSELARKFSDTSFGKRAKGALTRLQGRGQVIPFKGTSSGGKSFDLASARGKITVVHFWTSDATRGLDEIKKLNAKWDKDINIIGANIDIKSEKFAAFMKQNPQINWFQLHAPGGMEQSPLAVQVGLVSLPMAMLFDKEGKLVDSNVPLADLDREIQRLSK